MLGDSVTLRPSSSSWRLQEKQQEIVGHLKAPTTSKTEENVQYQNDSWKNVVWQVTEGGYCILDPFIEKLSSVTTLCVGQKYACLIGKETGTQKAPSGKFFVQHLRN